MVHFYKTKMWYCDNLFIANYENIFDYSFDFNSEWVDKDLERKIGRCFNKLSNYENLTNERNNFLGAGFLLFDSAENPIYILLVKLRPYDGLIGIDNLVLGQILEKFYDCMLFFTMRLNLYTSFNMKVQHVVLLNIALQLSQQIVATFECNIFLSFH